MDVLRELERMHAAAWEREQAERTLLARLEDQADGLRNADEAREAHEGAARAAVAEAERLLVKIEGLAKENRGNAEQLAQEQAAATELRRRVDAAEPLVEELRA
ncbi:unnamed protein product, partial [Ectocarpus sp. 13 AM-2016]